VGRKSFLMNCRFTRPYVRHQLKELTALPPVFFAGYISVSAFMSVPASAPLFV
jgi:hypothetical protein